MPFQSGDYSLVRIDCDKNKSHMNQRPPPPNPTHPPTHTNQYMVTTLDMSVFCVKCICPTRIIEQSEYLYRDIYVT